MGLHITNGRVVDPANDLDTVTDIYVCDGHIAALGEPPAGFTVERTIDASDRVVCPGLVDLCARLGEPSDAHVATIASETRAAASAGITTLCCPPDTEPVIDIPAIVELIHRRSEQAGFANVVCIGALTAGLAGTRLAEMQALKAIGCVGVSNAQRPVVDTEVLRRAMQYAATCGLKVFLRSEDARLGALGHMHEGAVSTRLGIPAVPETAETIAIARDLLLIEETGVEAHFRCVSSARAVKMIGEARAGGLAVTADVGVSHLHLTDQAIGLFNTYCHVRPPFRSGSDRDGLIDGLRTGALNAVCSDHQPHDEDDKTAPFSATAPGISALESLLPLTLAMVKDGVLGLPQAIALLTHKPAEVLGIPAGTLDIGANADICIFDPDHSWTLAEEGMWSAGKNTPFMHHQLLGKVTHTLLNGELIFDLDGDE